MKTTWLLDTQLTARSTPASGLKFDDALRRIGCEVATFTLDRKTGRYLGEMPELGGGPVVAYGSYRFVREMRAKDGVRFPGAFCEIDKLSFSVAAGHLGPLMMNSDFIILPFGEARRRTAAFPDLFMRPDRVTKAFTGFSYLANEHDHEMRSLKELANIGEDELVVIAPWKDIIAEYRYVIADGEIVAKSGYGWEEDFTPSAKTDPRCDAVAKTVAATEWQPDRVYTCDVALFRDGGSDKAGVVELNAFSCSGLYACDTARVAEAVTRAAEREFAGD